MLIRFQCECGKKLKAAAEQAGRRGQCSACGRMLTVPRASAPAAKPAATVLEKPWYFSRRGKIFGPLSPEALRDTAAGGGLAAGDLVLAPGAARWVPASDVAGLFPEPVAKEPAGRGPGPQAAALETPFESRHEVLAEAQVVPDPTRCVQCGICSFNCPMAIDVRAHARRGRPIHDSRCLTCSQCVNRCPRGVLQFERLEILGLGLLSGTSPGP